MKFDRAKYEEGISKDIMYQIFSQVFSENGQPDEDVLCFVSVGGLVVANKVGAADRFGRAGAVRYLVP